MNENTLTIPVVRPMGFCLSESGLVLVVDPTALVPYLKEDVLPDWLAKAMCAWNAGDYEIDLGSEGKALAVCVPGAARGRHVLVKERLGTGDLELDDKVKDAA